MRHQSFQPGNEYGKNLFFFSSLDLFHGILCTIVQYFDWKSKSIYFYKRLEWKIKY